jgi:NADPH:quinone reductase-like Zn-dependent oxidoreductase
LFKKIAGIFLILVVIAVTALALVLGHSSACEEQPFSTSATTTMSAAIYRCYGSPDVIEIVKTEKPSPKDNEVLVKIKAASVNPLDWHYMRGSPYFMRLGSGIGAPNDFRMGVDFAGTVEAVGKSVTRFSPGDRVFGGKNGAFAEYLVIGEDRSIVKIPDNVTFEQAAATPIAGLTALQGLRDHGQLKAGQKVLINGASGGVGTFAVQLAKAMGANVSGVCSTRNVDLVLAIGADQVFDYTKEDYTQSGQKFDLIIDNVGNHSILKNRKALKPGGRLIIIGGGKGNWLGPMIQPISAMIIAPFVDEHLEMMLAQMRPDDLGVLADLMGRGELTPVFDRRYPLSETADAIRNSELGRARGKIIINVE